MSPRECKSTSVNDMSVPEMETCSGESFDQHLQK